MKRTFYILFLPMAIVSCMLKKHPEEQKTAIEATNFQFKEIEELPVQSTSPQLMIDRFGDTIQSLSAWKQHREYIKELLTFYQYGRMPPRPVNVKVVETNSSEENGKIHSSYDFTISRNGHSVTLGVGLIRPLGQGPYPVIIKNDRYRFDLKEVQNKKAREKYTKQNRISIDFFVANESVKRGYIYCKFNREDIALDVKGSKTKGIFNLYPEYEWGAITAWAWTYQIVIDWLQKQSFVDMKKIVATGHSRGGKTALCAGIYDERITITAPNSSGLGGTASLRFYDFSRGTEVQTIPHQSKKFPYWWPDRWYSLNDHIEKIPFDAHFAKALIAPRALFNTHARHDYWANPYGTHLTYLRSQPVFDLYKVNNHNTIHWRDGGHGQNKEDWLALLDYCDMVFYQKTFNRSFNENPYPEIYQYQSLDAHDITKLKSISFK